MTRVSQGSGLVVAGEVRASSVDGGEARRRSVLMRPLCPQMPKCGPKVLSQSRREGGRMGKSPEGLGTLSLFSTKRAMNRNFLTGRGGSQQPPSSSPLPAPTPRGPHGDGVDFQTCPSLFSPVNSYGHPAPPHLYSGPSPMYPIPTQDSPGYNRPGKETRNRGGSQLRLVLLGRCSSWFPWSDSLDVSLPT